MSENLWWRGGIIYQIYPRSFMDANGDGIGDLQGIIQRLDYIESLGVDAIWISPFFKSPMKDFGYDISDYRDVDPMFGTMADFDQLLAACKQRQIKVMIDQVLSHTSDQHPWFEESRQNKHNDKADWYVWADAKPDGTPPNNWLSIFGGSAWQWDSRRKQYYLHNFLASQPDLNFHNEAVQQAVLDNVKFWLDKGVDGFRLDAINFCFHDAQLRDNPAKAPEHRKGAGFSEDNPYAYQYHYFNNTQPENLHFLERIRALIDQYDARVTLGEVASEDSLQTMSEYTEKDKRLHMAYSFELLSEHFSPAHIREVLETYETKVSGGWPCWAIGNHDVARVITRWGKNQHQRSFAIMLNQLLGSLKGSICCYQGEELGLIEAELTFEQLQDPYGIAFWPQFKGRDGCRTPMPWQHDAPQLGFSNSTAPWLPLAKTHAELAVDLQQQDPDSVLNHYRRFVSWRKQQPALISGDIRFVYHNEHILCFERKTATQTMLVCVNFTAYQQPLNVADWEIKPVNLKQPIRCEYQQLDLSHVSDDYLLQPFQVVFLLN
jgi:alpha-glucosidase